MNIIDELGILAIATRLQRLSEQLRKDGAQIYEEAGIHFEPKWFPVIYVLHRRSPLTVGEIAGEIGYTHPSIISLLRELEKEGLVRSARDDSDHRKRLIYVTPRAEALIHRMKPVWEVMTRVMTVMLDTPHHLLRALDEVEEALKQESFLARYLAS